MTDISDLADRMEELERVFAFQQGQIIGLLTLEIARALHTPTDLAGLVEELRRTRPDPLTPVGAGFDAVLESLDDALACRDDVAVQ